MGDWQDTGCGGPAVRQNEDGSYEIEGEGARRIALPPAVFAWAGLINAASAKHSVPAPFIAGIMALESRGNANAVSPSNALGLMQLIPSTARGLAKTSLTPSQILEPERNVDLGAQYVADLWQRYGGNPVRVAFAYNAGSAKCGGGLSHTPGEGRCAANRFNLVADCNSVAHGTVDYAGPVLAFANSALDSGKFAAGPAPSGGGGGSSGGSGGIAAFLTLALLGGVVLYARRPS